MPLKQQISLDFGDFEDPIKTHFCPTGDYGFSTGKDGFSTGKIRVFKKWVLTKNQVLLWRLRVSYG